MKGAPGIFRVVRRGQPLWRVQLMRRGIKYHGGDHTNVELALRALAELHTELRDLKPFKRGPKARP